MIESDFDPINIRAEVIGTVLLKQNVRHMGYELRLNQQLSIERRHVSSSDFNFVRLQFATMIDCIAVTRLCINRVTCEYCYSCLAYSFIQCVLYIGQAFRYSPENAFYVYNQQIYFII